MGTVYLNYSFSLRFGELLRRNRGIISNKESEGVKVAVKSATLLGNKVERRAATALERWFCLVNADASLAVQLSELLCCLRAVPVL